VPTNGTPFPIPCPFLLQDILADAVSDPPEQRSRADPRMTRSFGLDQDLRFFSNPLGKLFEGTADLAVGPLGNNLLRDLLLLPPCVLASRSSYSRSLLILRNPPLAHLGSWEPFVLEGLLKNGLARNC
jgi:hypothetical protein